MNELESDMTENKGGCLDPHGPECRGERERLLDGCRDERVVGDGVERAVAGARRHFPQGHRQRPQAVLLRPGKLSGLRGKGLRAR